MPNQASAAARALESDFASRLARFFPDATPLRIPIHLSRASENGASDNGHGQADGNGDGHAGNTWEGLQDTTIEFGTPSEVLFVVAWLVGAWVAWHGSGRGEANCCRIISVKGGIT